MSPVVELKSVYKRYKLGTTYVDALRGLSLQLQHGEFTALVGASGSGKSTLLNLTGCLDVPSQGEVWIENQNVALLSENAKSELRNQKIGFIFQSFNLIPVLNVYENVELPLLVNPLIPVSERKERILKALENVELQDFIQHTPEKLSGGQRQRVAIARALVSDPVLVLADEPTANLDSVTTHKIIDLMMELNEKTHVTFFFSTHDEKLMGRVKRIIRIQDGMLVP